MKYSRCENCRWWGLERSHLTDIPIGTCRAKSPTISTTELMKNKDGSRLRVERGRWRWVASDDWCGDWEKGLKQ